MIIEQINDPSGKVRIRWRIVSINEDVWFKYDHVPSLAELQAQEVIYLDTILYRNDNKVEMKIEEDVDTIKKIITQIKNNPTTTLAQLNTYLSTLQWYEEYTIRFFIYAFGRKLADRKDVSISAITPTAFWNAVRDYIVATPSRKLAKLILGQDVSI